MTAIKYRLSMPVPHSHLFHVEVRVEASSETIDLALPSWTPGSYLMREFPRQVQDFEAHSEAGERLAWSKTDKNTWRVSAPSEGELRARYRVYANELTVRTSHLDDTHGYVNGASVFMFVRGRETEPLDVEIETPAGWQVTTALSSVQSNHFRALNYDELVDSPFEIGTHQLVEWEQEGLPHRYAIWGAGPRDPERLLADTRRIIEATRQLFGTLPYASYTFIVHVLPGGRGGLEHANSTSLQADPKAFTDDKEYESFLALVAHEFFHVWNAKRIRPEPLGPFDYTRENYTRNLWVVEGLTTYYTDLILRRAGLISEERYLTRLSESIRRLQVLPGRHHQTLEESSFDTWIKFYRPDEHTPNAQVSYYHKGALVGFLLDLEIRRATENRRSLDDLMRLLWERYGARDQGFPEDGRRGIQALAEEVSGETLEEFFNAYVRGTEELDYERHLATVGLELRTEGETSDEKAGLQEVRLGVRTREQQDRLRITHVLENTPAYDAGINAGDEIVAVDGVRVTSTTFAGLLQACGHGDRVSLTLFRRDRLVTVSAVLGPQPQPRLRLAEIKDASDLQRKTLRSWLAATVSSPGVDRGIAAG